MNDDNGDFESWEGDYLLIQEEDWVGLLRLRKEKAKNNPKDLYCQWRYGEALVFNKEYSNAIDFLTPIYNNDPDYDDVVSSILDALFGLGKTENDFDWVEKPVVLKLDDKTKNSCTNFLKNKRKPVPFLRVYEHLIFQSDYIAFKEKDLCEYLKNDRIFVFSGELMYFWDVDIKLSKEK